jgi:hypothetical protein
VGVFGPGARCGECMLLACLRPRHWELGEISAGDAPQMPGLRAGVTPASQPAGGSGGRGGEGAYRGRGSASEARKKIAARR